MLITEPGVTFRGEYDWKDLDMLVRSRYPTPGRPGPHVDAGVTHSGYLSSWLADLGVERKRFLSKLACVMAAACSAPLSSQTASRVRKLWIHFVRRGASPFSPGWEMIYRAHPRGRPATVTMIPV